MDRGGDLLIYPILRGWELDRRKYPCPKTRLYHVTIYIITISLWFDVTLQSDVREVSPGMSVPTQPYAMTPDSLRCYWKRPETSKPT